MKLDFVDWVLEEMRARKWSQSDLARHAGIARGTVSNILNQRRDVGFKTCQCLAKAFGWPTEYVLDKAGLLNSEPEADMKVGSLVIIAEQLVDEDKDVLLSYANFLLWRNRE